MRAKPLSFVEERRITKENCKLPNFPYLSDASFGNNGMFLFRLNLDVYLRCLVSDHGGWDHVSVSVEGYKLMDRVPTWEEMQIVKEFFWEETETVVQFHPKQSAYVNKAQVLHLWKKQGAEYELPPKEFV